nr:MAG TPA: hypothetical protein [Caudoviricetes sp.]
MLILFNKYINTIIYLFIKILSVVVLVGGGPAAYCSRTTTEGARQASQCGGARRRNSRF